MSHKFLNIDWDAIDKKNKEINATFNNENLYYKPQTYFVPPPFINSTLVYYDVNNDKNLREMMTEYFLKKSKNFIKSKNSLAKLNSPNGYKIIYEILRYFVKKYDINWYDLKEKYDFVKDYIIKKIGRL